MKQKGFTFIELIVALGVGTVILSGVVGSFFLSVHGVTKIRNEIVALSDIERAAHWLTRDVPLGGSTNLVDAAPPVTQMTLTWFDYTKEAELAENQSHYVSYTWSSDTGELQRSYDGVITVAGVRLANVGFSLDGEIVTVTLSTYIDEESESTVTRTYKIFMRGRI